MTIATFKDLCVDAADAARTGRFWAGALGLELHHQDDGGAYLTGPTKSHTVWINPVPEPKTVKHRIHIDVHGSSVEALEQLGATVIDRHSFPWVVMADPEGAEFCLFVREQPPDYRLYEVVIDCADHAAASAWWAAVIGGTRVLDERGFSYLEEVPNVPFGNLSFLPVDEPKSAKNRVHIDVVAPDIAPLLDLGATLLRPRDDEIGWDVLADPEGNEFCVFSAH